MALAAALQQASLSLDTMGLEGVRLRDLLESEILRRFPDAKIWFPESLRLPNVSSLCFPGVHQEALLYYLSRKGIYASMGGSYGQHLSRLLIASKIPEKEALSSLSFSLSRMTTEEEVLQAAKGICDAALRLRALSIGVS
jgi:cysteine desulfurase